MRQRGRHGLHAEGIVRCWVGSIRVWVGGVGVRVRPEYPGTRTGTSVNSGDMVAFTETRAAQHDGRVIRFYKLADGRGWIH